MGGIFIYLTNLPTLLFLIRCQVSEQLFQKLSKLSKDSYSFRLPRSHSDIRAACEGFRTFEDPPSPHPLKYPNLCLKITELGLSFRCVSRYPYFPFRGFLLPP